VVRPVVEGIVDHGGASSAPCIGECYIALPSADSRKRVVFELVDHALAARDGVQHQARDALSDGADDPCCPTWFERLPAHEHHVGDIGRGDGDHAPLAGEEQGVIAENFAHRTDGIADRYRFLAQPDAETLCL